MRLYSFQIKGFKSIIDTGECKISEIDNIVVLAGQNEAGKSAVLEALDFFGNGPSDKFEKYQKRLNSSLTDIKCTFLLEKKDFQYLQAYTKEISLLGYIKKNKYLKLTRSHNESGDSGIKLDEEYFNNFQVKETTVGDVQTGDTGQIKEEGGGGKTELQSTDKPVNKEGLIKDFLQEIPKIVPKFSLYSSFEDLLPSEIEIQKINENKAVKDFESVFSVDLTSITQVADPRKRKIEIEKLENSATDDFNKSWHQKISSIKDDKEYKFFLEIIDRDPKKIIFMIKGHDNIPLYLEQKSLGFRWFSAFHLRLRSLMCASSKSTEEEYKRSILLLIDEPGQNLHETAQRDAKAVIEETSEKGIQIIYSTHNPNLIGTKGKEFTRLRLVSNYDKEGTRIENIAQLVSSGRKGYIDALSPIRTAMGLNTINLIEKDEYNVVVEGITDHYYLSSFQKILGKEWNLKFLPACGVDNVKHIIGLLLGWGYSYKAVFDDDKSQGRKVYNELKKHYYENDDNLAHEHIYKITNCTGIEDMFAKRDFSKYVIGRRLIKGEKKLKNSEIAKNVGKEAIARVFLEKVETNVQISLSKDTMKKINEIFEWLRKKFKIK